MSDQTDYVDPASTWPAGVPADAALRQLEGRIRALEEGEDRPEATEAPVARPSTFGATDQERADFEAWLAAGRPGPGGDRGERDERVTTSTTPGLVGFPAGTPAAEPATGAGPEAGPVTSAGNPDYPDASREGDARPGRKAGK